MKTLNDPFKHSLWAITAVEPPETKILQSSMKADVAIIGAGYTGLSCALHLAESGLNTVVLESHTIGYGASGRNGGQVNAGLKLNPDELEMRFGKAKAKDIFASTEGSTDLVFDLVKKHQLNCELERCGFLYAFASKAMLAKSEIRCDWLQASDINVEILSSDETAQRVGHAKYIGGLFDARGGALQPLSYARELARVAKKTAQIFTNSPAISLQKTNTGWHIKTQKGSIDANKVVICTNAYTPTKLWPKLEKTVIPVFSFQIATNPLTKEQQVNIIPSRHTISDTRRLMLYYRYDAHNRLILGGRGGALNRQDFEGYKHLIQKVTQLFPQISSDHIEYYWNGQVALTTDGLPHIHSPDTNLFAALGLNGRGVAMGTLLGKWLASAVTEGMPKDALPLSTINAIPFHGWRKPAIQIATLGKSIQDRLGI